MPAEPKEPRTAAGKAMLAEWEPADGPDDTLERAILAIEDQAATEARRELLAKVEGLPYTIVGVDGMVTMTHALEVLKDYSARVRRLIEDPSR